MGEIDGTGRLVDERDDEPTMQRYDFELLPICQAIHSSVNGASDPLNTPVLQQYIRFLEMRLNAWKPGFHKDARFDEAVRRLCEVALAEGEADFARRTFTDKRCEHCDRFQGYDSSAMRRPDDCVTWLCNTRRCPLDCACTDESGN